MLYDFDKPTDRKNSNSYKWDRYAPEVIPMWIADMDFEVAPPIKQALIDISTHAIVGYNHTPDELTEVVIERLKTRHGWEIQKEWIVWLPGLVPGLHTAARCISDDYYAVMTSSPVYKPFLEAAEIGKRRLQNIPFIWQNDRWEMDFEEMKRTVNPSTRLYMLCNPHNPTGRVFDRSELEQLVAFCLENNLVLCSDEIHCDLILDDTKQHLSIATISKEIENQSITLLAPSKTFNIAGLGCSIAIIPNKELRQNFEKTIYGIMPRPTGFSYEAALAAYKSCEDWRVELVAYLKQNHDYLLKEMNSIPGLSMIAAEATYLAWINYEKTGIENFTEVLEKNGVGVMDAKIFGGEKHFRLNFGTQRAVLEEAVKRIKNSLS
ncbi:putative C-S lyase [Emticicia sp. CRIBPO]|uniref:MalY/PatB family protein n=1 Tax=Emticicia sp. CRIBPO TaxID=2683258 RepID=UPI001411ECDD|nr:PatB family C-S lyase [Emticicia sp. CRIBPO]NBA88774.1 putative C-S lyase [Emticicia sp. CRIBPO]